MTHFEKFTFSINAKGTRETVPVSSLACSLKALRVCVCDGGVGGGVQKWRMIAKPEQQTARERERDRFEKTGIEMR